MNTDWYGKRSWRCIWQVKSGCEGCCKKGNRSSNDLGDEYDKEKGRERASDYDQTNESGARDPMSPEKIASHEPTAVKRDINQGTSGEPV